MSEYGSWKDELDGCELVGHRWVRPKRPFPYALAGGAALAAAILALALAGALFPGA